ncbi:hypothetical protein CNYM01_13051 [Colletotrichum nymphaeae SA-01]|uniref:Secreted protein n=1 Tax=Colletotrichum nymphaeae SA-01 TaxID=1460502 RepID=A0A135TK96_9PEZI|nr:hypothetical protein CNYM01_13051 [Colletotrichum nymphaeae SA-01]
MNSKSLFILLVAASMACANPVDLCKKAADGTVDKRCGSGPILDHCNCKMWVPGKTAADPRQYMSGDFHYGTGVTQGTMKVTGGAGQGSTCSVTWDRGDNGRCGYWNQINGPTGSGCQQFQNVWFSCDEVYK